MAGWTALRTGVVGFSARCEEESEQYVWTEYQLFQPDTGQYLQLAQFQGHWTVVKPNPEPSENARSNSRSIRRPEGTYQLYNRYEGRVLWAVGEFDWDIEGDDRLKISEYILPPICWCRR